MTMCEGCHHPRLQLWALMPFMGTANKVVTLVDAVAGETCLLPVDAVAGQPKSQNK